MNLLRKLWGDQRGAVVSVEILVIATVLVIGVIVAWSAVRNAVLCQIEEQAHWISGEEFDEEECCDILTCADVVDDGP